MDNAGIRLLWLVGLGNIHHMHDSLALAVHPGPGKREIRPRALFEAQDVLIETNRIGEIPGPDVEMVEHAYAHAHAVHSLFCEILWSRSLAQNRPKATNEGVALHCAGRMVRLPPKTGSVTPSWSPSPPRSFKQGNAHG